MSDVLDVPEWVPGAGWAGFGALGTLWLVGPSIRAVGRNLGRWTDYHTSNLLKLSAKVERRLEGDQEQAGEVHPRVAKEVIDAAAWIDDDVHQEYLANILVNGRSKDGKDDSAMYWVRLLNAMPAGAVRLHHAIYGSYFGTVRSTEEQSGRTFLSVNRLRGLTISAPHSELAEIAGGATHSLARANDVLYREGLITGMAPVAGVDEVQYVPNGTGAQLFTDAFFGRGVNADVLLFPLEYIETHPMVKYTPAPDGPTLSSPRIGEPRPNAPLSADHP